MMSVSVNRNYLLDIVDRVKPVIFSADHHKILPSVIKFLDTACTDMSDVKTMIFSILKD
jgi:hypothetical protein